MKMAAKSQPKKGKSAPKKKPSKSAPKKAAAAKKPAAPKKKAAKAAPKKAAAAKKSAPPKKAAAKKSAAPKKAKSAKAPAGKAIPLADFVSMTYLTENGVKEWLKQGRLTGLQADSGEWMIEAANLELPDVKRLMR
jgi:hypothetical protein